MNKSSFQNILVATQSAIPGAIQDARGICDHLNSVGFRAKLSDLISLQGPGDLQDDTPDLMIVLGGDGTVLRAGHICAPLDIPILAIHRARFGFLIEVCFDSWKDVIPRIEKGDYWFEKRMMLQAEQWRGEKKLGSWNALNEAFVGRGLSVRPVHLVTHLDGKLVTTYVADGLITATPTGSTAYALASGGPILPPDLRNLLIMPVAPHFSVDRAIVLPEGIEISVTVLTGHEAVLSIDGQKAIPLQDGDRMVVRASENSVRFLRFEESEYFFRRIFQLMDTNPSAGDAK
ncbi:MAG: NAD(+)/NADH kinase [Anaerolineales bacterium]|nr:NAD(+)/NADH kinase [Anaerolineales bacterium]